MTMCGFGVMRVDHKPETKFSLYMYVVTRKWITKNAFKNTNTNFVSIQLWNFSTVSHQNSVVHKWGIGKHLSQKRKYL